MIRKLPAYWRKLLATHLRILSRRLDTQPTVPSTNASTSPVEETLGLQRLAMTLTYMTLLLGMSCSTVSIPFTGGSFEKHLCACEVVDQLHCKTL